MGTTGRLLKDVRIQCIIVVLNLVMVRAVPQRKEHKCTPKKGNNIVDRQVLVDWYSYKKADLFESSVLLGSVTGFVPDLRIPKGPILDAVS